VQVPTPLYKGVNLRENGPDLEVPRLDESLCLLECRFPVLAAVDRKLQLRHRLLHVSCEDLVEIDG
jgi:hypothetical protein